MGDGLYYGKFVLKILRDPDAKQADREKAEAILFGMIASFDRRELELAKSEADRKAIVGQCRKTLLRLELAHRQIGGMLQGLTRAKRQRRENHAYTEDLKRQLAEAVAEIAELTRDEMGG